MREADREVGFGDTPRDDADGGTDRHRRAGDLLLRVDEMEETLQALRDAPPDAPLRPGESREETLHALEGRLAAERARLEALEHGGGLRYDDITRAMLLSDAMG
jgi:hypothetical protein